MAAVDPDEQRSEMLERWDRAAAGWGKRADQIRQLPVSTWMIDQLGLQPGQTVLELAAGPGDTGLLAAELITPGGKLISSDASEAMLEIARRRASELGVTNVEFKQLELEWIDLPTADVDGVLCRFGLMLIVDPAAALREIRRVLRPGGRVAVVVWARSEDNPWATIPTRALTELGFGSRPDPGAPGMFALSDPQALSDLLGDAGFVEVQVATIPSPRLAPSVEAFIEETIDLSMMFAGVYNSLSDDDQARVRDRIASLLEPYVGADGSVELPGTALGVSAEA